MRIAAMGRFAVLALLLIGGTACNRGEQSREISALDNAYKSGVLTKSECELKRAALESQSAALAALARARDAGVLSADEYQARRNRLALNAGQMMALERSRQAGELTQAEYLAEKSALLVPGEAAPDARVAQAAEPQAVLPAEPAALPSSAGTIPAAAPLPLRPVSAVSETQPQSVPPSTASSRPAPPPPPVTAAATQGHVLRLKMVKAMDQTGFERPIPSASMLIPTDWQAQGGTTWNIKDNCNTIQTHLRTAGPDGRGVEVFPAFKWVWADDPKFMQMSAAQTAKSGNRPCDVMPPMKAGDFLRRNLARYRPNAQLVGLEPAPRMMRKLEEIARQSEQQAAQYNLKQRIQSDAVKGRVRYSVNGHAVEEWIVVATIITGTAGPSLDVRTNRMGQSVTYNCVAYVTGESAPQGQLDASEKFFDLVTGTYRWDPAWQARVSGHAQAMGQIAQKGEHDRAAIRAKSAEDIRNIRQQSYEYAQRSADSISEQRSQATREVETYRNPTTGDMVELSNQYGQAWVNNKGEYLLSDQPGFDPSVTFKEDWKALERIKK